jgi:GNAT superfamily N-acetyltransferase
VSDIEVRAIDTQDEGELRAWWETGRAAAAERPYDVYPAWEHSRVALPEVNAERDLTLLAAYDGDAMVGIAASELPLLDNTHACWMDVGVPAERRRRGIGTALVDEVERLARKAGRTHVLGAAFTPPGGESDGTRFAASHGYLVAHREGAKVLDLHDHPDWSALDAEVAERIGDYRLVGWREHTPEEHLDDLGRAISTFFSMVPTGDLALEDGEWTPDRMRENEERGEPRSMRFCAAALAPDGELVGYTDLHVSRSKTSRASVGITFVLPGHRGHSLGLATKLASHRALQDAVPECATVRTSNADVNTHMNVVNERMGYRLVEDVIEVQKALTAS